MVAEDVRNTTTVRVRRGRSYDLNAVAELWADCGLVPSPQGFRNEMERMLIKSPELFLVAVEAVDGGQIVGALLGSFDGRAATVSRLATHPDRRRQGIATELVDTFATMLDELGAPDAMVLVLDIGPDAERFWSALDYQRTTGVAAYRRA